MLSRRELDGFISGSVMVNNRKHHRLSAIVYDKLAQMYEKFKVVLPHETLRIEVRTSDASLSDVSNPDPLFFKLAAPDLIDSPPGIDAWTKRELAPMNLEPLPDLTDYQRAMNLLDFSPDVARLIEILSRNGPAMRQMVLRKLGERVESSVDATPAPDRKSA